MGYRFRPIHSIALDIGANKMYWSESVSHSIYSANLDGTDIEMFISTENSPMGIAVNNPVPIPGSIFLFITGLAGLAALKRKKFKK